MRLLIFCIFLAGCAAKTSVVRSQRMDSFDYYGTKVVRRERNILRQYKRIAVTDFKSPDGVDGAGTEIADRISIELMKRGYKVVERDHLKTLLKERYMNYVGVVNPDGLKEFKAVSGADAIVTGIIGTYSGGVGSSSFAMGNMGGASSTAQSEVSLTIKMFDVESGDILFSAAGAKAGQSARGSLASQIISGAFMNYPVHAQK